MYMPRSNDNLAMDFQKVLSVNEKIKEVLRISGTLNMSAINAMLVAKRAGSQAKGFGVVSSELRLFSRKLVETVELLNRETAQLVSKVADLQKLDRMHHLMATALAHAQKNDDLLKNVLRLQESHRHSTVLLIEEEKRKFRNSLNRANKLCDIGYSLARNAKVEAAYGGEMTKTLWQLAEGVEAVIAPLAPMLKSLRSDMDRG